MSKNVKKCHNMSQYATSNKAKSLESIIGQGTWLKSTN